MRISFLLFIPFILGIITNSANAQDAAALNFDGVNDNIIIAHNSLLKPAAAISIQAWIKPVDIHTNMYCEIYRKDDGNSRHLFSFQNFGTILSFGLEIGGTYSELDVPISAYNYEGQWIQVTAVYDGSAKKIYRNGELIGAQNISGAIGTAGSAPAYIGSYGGTSEYFRGSIDELKIWNRGLTDFEILNNIDCESTGPQNGLLAYYKFNEGLAGADNTGITTLYDSSGNNLNGFLLNFNLVGNTSNWINPGAIQAGNICSTSYVYEFNGNGNWTDTANWVNRKIPPAPVNTGALVIINPAGECIVDKPVTMPLTTSLSVQPGKIITIPSSLNNNSEAPAHYIGEVYDGGIIFYLNITGKHGLVCSAELGTAPWDLTIFNPQFPDSYNPPLIGVPGTGIGAGSANTLRSVAATGAGLYAASVCKSYSGGGFIDWYLPSKDELNLIYRNLKITGLASFIPVDPPYYWSSSEIDNKNVWSQKFDDGSQVNFSWKNNQMNIRAVRAF